MGPPDAAGADTPLLRAYPPLFKNRNFVFLWGGYVISALGDRIHFLVMLELLCSVLLGQKDYGTQQSSQLTIAMLAPFLLLGPVTGIIADRFPRRAIMITSDLARVVIVILVRTIFLEVLHLRQGMTPDAHTFKIGMMLLFSSEFLLAIFAATFSPARLALLPNLVHPTQLLRANSMTAAAGTIASLVGFVLGSWLISHDLVVAMYVDAATFLTSAACIFAMRVPKTPVEISAAPAKKQNVFNDFAQGIRYMRQHRRVLQIILLMFLFWSCGTVILNGLAGIITKPAYFGLPKEWVGYFLGIVGVGMVAGAALASLAKRGIPKEFGIAFSMIMVGVFLLAFTFVRSWWMGLILLCFAGAFGAVLLVTLDTLLQRIVPNHVRGRMMGIKDVISTMGLIGAAVPLAIDPNVDALIMTVLMVMSGVVLVVGVLLLIYYYRRQPLHAGLALLIRLGRAYLVLWQRFERVGPSLIPGTGPVIVVANHVSGMDPLMLQISSPRRVIHFMMAKEYYNKRPMYWLYKALGIIPVNRTGNDTASVRAALRTLEAGKVLGLFPEGRVTTTGQLQEAHNGVAMLVLMSGATVVPAYISGNRVHENFIKDFVGRAHLKIQFGRPIRFTEYTKKNRDRESLDKVTAAIMGAIKAIRDKTPGATPVSGENALPANAATE